MGKIGKCCCCPLVETPWEKAKAQFLGMTFEVDLPAPDSSCCQTKLSDCEDIGEPVVVRDCYLFTTGSPTTWVEDLFQYLSTSGPWCDWPLVVVPFTAVDGCCGSSNYRFQTTGVNRMRHWVWIQARVRFIVCYCTTAEGQPGYRVRLEITWQITRIFNTSRLIKYRHRKYTRVCCDDPGYSDVGEEVGEGGGAGGDVLPGDEEPPPDEEPCTDPPICVSEPPEPGWTDNSGSNEPLAPFLKHGALGMSGCPTRPAVNPVFDPTCIGSCSAIALIPGCLDPSNYYVEQFCTDETVNTCFGPGTLRVPSRWNIVGFDGFGTESFNGSGVWESGVMELTPNCTEDVGDNPMTVEVSRAAQEIEIVAECPDVYGVMQSPYKITLPTVIPVCLERDGALTPC